MADEGCCWASWTALSVADGSSCFMGSKATPRHHVKGWLAMDGSVSDECILSVLINDILMSMGYVSFSTLLTGSGRVEEILYLS